MTVLSSRSVLPAIADIANPGGAGGAVVGLGVPLGGSSDKGALMRPMERGAYAIASTDRKTVLRMVVMSKEEASYDPEPFVGSSMAVGAEPELIARVRATWSIAQLNFESHDPGVYPALDFLAGVAVRTAGLSEGVIADSICKRYQLPGAAFVPVRIHPSVDARDHVAVRFEERPDGVHAFTLGMQKFALEEYEIVNLDEASFSLAERFLLTMAQAALTGRIPRLGNRFGAANAPFEVADGGFDLSLWEGIPVFELRPPVSCTSGEALRRWAESA